MSKLLKEFKKAHNEYSLSRWGHWSRKWKVTLKHMDLKGGYWYWKGHRVVDL